MNLVKYRLFSTFFLHLLIKNGVQLNFSCSNEVTYRVVRTASEACDIYTDRTLTSAK